MAKYFEEKSRGTRLAQDVAAYQQQQAMLEEAIQELTDRREPELHRYQVCLKLLEEKQEELVSMKRTFEKELNGTRKSAAAETDIMQK